MMIKLPWTTWVRDNSYARIGGAAHCRVSDPAGIDLQESGRGRAEKGKRNSQWIDGRSIVRMAFFTSEIKKFIIINQSE